MTRLPLALLVLAACEATPDDARLGPEAEAPGTTPPPFLGTEWRLAAVDGAPPDALPGGDALVTVTFTDAPFGDLDPDAWALGGFNGCNDFGMAYRLDRMPVPVEGAGFGTGMFASDAMACGAPGEHVSDHVTAGLAESVWLRIERGRLHLVDSTGTERLTFAPRPIRAVDAAAVVTGRWRLDPAASTIANGYGGAPGRYTVAFSPDSTYSGTAGCIAFSGTYVLTGDRLRVTSYDRDDGACAPADRHWDGPHGLDAGELEADPDRLVIHLRRGERAVFTRP